jgi:hypothetical protein
MTRAQTISTFLLAFSRTITFLTVVALGLSNSFAASSSKIPKPTDRLAPPPPAPAVEESVVNLKVSVAVNELAVAADAAVPREGAQEETWQDGGTLPGYGAFAYIYRFVRGPVSVRAAGNRLVTEFPEVQYRLVVRMTNPRGEAIEGECGHAPDPPKRLRLLATSVLSWSDKWTLESETSFDEPQFDDSCRLTNLGIDGTPIVKSLVIPRLQPLAVAIDAKVRERTEARKRVEAVWRALQEPTALPPNLWLTLNPTSAEISPIRSDGDQLIRTSVNLLLRPTASTGPQPSVNAQPVPSLQLSPRSLDGFHLTLPILAKYSEINRQLSEHLVGEEIPTSVGRSLKIVSAQLYGSGANLILEMGVTGAMNGKLYATGKPVVDVATHTLSFEQFNFTVETKNVLVRTASWLLHSKLLSVVEPETHIDLSDEIETLRRQLSGTLTRELVPGTWLEGSVENLRARAIYPVPGGVEIQILADGLLQLSVR